MLQHTRQILRHRYGPVAFDAQGMLECDVISGASIQGGKAV